jgi:hypothetical protein
MMNWDGCGTKQSWPLLKYCPSIYLYGQRIPTRTESETSQINRSDNHYTAILIWRGTSVLVQQFNSRNAESCSKCVPNCERLY